jgi:serine/threonine protein kinase
MLGEGTTSKVYKCISVTDPNNVVALKLIKSDYLARGKDALREVEKEIKTL